MDGAVSFLASAALSWVLEQDVPAIIANRISSEALPTLMTHSPRPRLIGGVQSLIITPQGTAGDFSV